MHGVYTRPRLGLEIVSRYGKPTVKLGTIERHAFIAIRKAGKKLLAADDPTPSRWYRPRQVERDVANVTIAIVRGWRYFDDRYPVPGYDIKP